jgi:hypothetical protein
VGLMVNFASVVFCWSNWMWVEGCRQLLKVLWIESFLFWGWVVDGGWVLDCWVVSEL